MRNHDHLLITSMFLPFALQLLGWAGTPLGGGPCGSVFTAQVTDGQINFYPQLMLWGICLLMAKGFLLLMLSFMNGAEVPARQARPIALFAALLAAFTALTYLLTRVTGLPVPSSIGWLLGSPEPLDTVGILVLLALFAHIGFALRRLYSPRFRPKP